MLQTLAGDLEPRDLSARELSARELSARELSARGLGVGDFLGRISDSLSEKHRNPPGSCCTMTSAPQHRGLPDAFRRVSENQERVAQNHFDAASVGFSTHGRATEAWTIRGCQDVSLAWGSQSFSRIDQVRRTRFFADVGQSGLDGLHSSGLVAGLYNASSLDWYSVFVFLADPGAVPARILRLACVGKTLRAVLGREFYLVKARVAENSVCLKNSIHV